MMIDSFGFESYNVSHICEIEQILIKHLFLSQINCFEQLLINYFHEKVQQIFVDFNIRKEQDEYIREQIEWQPIDFTFNDLLCDLIERVIE